MTQKIFNTRVLFLESPIPQTQAPEINSEMWVTLERVLKMPCKAMHIVPLGLAS